MELVVFGASGPIGRQVVQQAVTAGHSVTAVTRNPDDFPIAASRVRVVSVDVTHPERVADSLAGSEAVISTFGVPYSRSKVTVYS